MFEGIAKELKEIRKLLKANSLLAATFGVTDLIVTNITATTGAALTLVAVTGKDIIMKLTDASGARKLSILDSGDTEVFKIDSDGKAKGTSFEGALIGNADTATLAKGVNAYSGADILTATVTAAVGTDKIFTYTNTTTSKVYLGLKVGSAYLLIEGTATSAS